MSAETDTTEAAFLTIPEAAREFFGKSPEWLRRWLDETDCPLATVQLSRSSSRRYLARAHLEAFAADPVTNETPATAQPPPVA